MIDTSKYVLIQSNTKTDVKSNEGRFGETTKGFFVTKPLVGLVNKNYWEGLKKFQAYILTPEKELIIAKFVKWQNIEDITQEEREKIQDFIDIQEQYGSFYNTIEEFNLITSQAENGALTTKRSAVRLGSQDFSEVV